MSTTVADRLKNLNSQTTKVSWFKSQPEEVQQLLRELSNNDAVTWRDIHRALTADDLPEEEKFPFGFDSMKKLGQLLKAGEL